MTEMDREAVAAFMDKFTEMAAATTTIGLLAVADRTGLLRSMAGAEPATSDQIAGFSNLEPRYVREILSGLAAAGVVAYQAGDATFHLPDAHAACLADDDSPYAMTGWLDMLPAVMSVLPGVANATINGGGVRLSDFDDLMVRGISRANTPSTRILLTRRWLPAFPGLVDRLEAGVRVADIGCGAGAAAIQMATAYPRSRVVGVDIDQRALALADRQARTCGLDNITFQLVGADELPGVFDVITSFDVIHDISDPLGALRRIRTALDPDGTFVMMEPLVGDALEDNLGARGALLYGISTLHCMTQSLAAGGAGLGTVWGPRGAEDLCRQAGFGSFRQIAVDNPLSAFYEVRH